MLLPRPNVWRCANLKETVMKWTRWIVALVMLGCGVFVQAQMGMDYFSRPAFTKVFHPTVGKGAEYEMTQKVGVETKTTNMEVGVVGKENSMGGDAYWIETIMAGEKGQPMIGKMLMTFTPDVKILRMIIQQPGEQAMEMPMNFGGQRQAKTQENVNEWHALGTETITVPAGTFSSEHWKNENNGGEVWTSEKVPTYGMVKMVSKDQTTVLVKVLNDYPDKVTGPVKKFDMQEMMQQPKQPKP